MKERIELIVKAIIKKFRKHRYLFTFLIFVLAISFVHPHHIGLLLSKRKILKNLQEQEVYYKDKIKSDSTRLMELLKDNTTLEKFAREQYYFHKPNEDVFVIEKNTINIK